MDLTCGSDNEALVDVYLRRATGSIRAEPTLVLKAAKLRSPTYSPSRSPLTSARHQARLALAALAPSGHRGIRLALTVLGYSILAYRKSGWRTKDCQTKYSRRS